MKKFLVLTLILGMVGLANAGLAIGLNGEDVDSADAPATISVIASNGQEAVVGLFLGLTGGAADISAAVNNVVPDSGVLPIDDPDILAMLGVDALYFLDLAIPAVPAVIIPDGAAVDGLMVAQAPAEGIMVTLIDGDTFEVLDSAMITPEPMTLALLGLGGLFLRRRK